MRLKIGFFLTGTWLIQMDEFSGHGVRFKAAKVSSMDNKKCL
jgi:hypothetical protein